MISEEKLLQILSAPHVSEKSSFVLEKNNVVVFNVRKSSNKYNIKCAVEYLFSVRVYHIRTVNVKGKVKKSGKNIGKRSNWKKAYVTLAPGQKINFFSKLDNKNKNVL